MAFSQLEIVSSSPFGCVLRDHNRKERCRDNNVKSVFDKNFNDLVRDHINGCISMSSPQGPQNRHVHKVKNDNPPASTIPSRPPPVLDRWVTWKSQDVALSNTNRHVNEAAETFLDPSQSYSNTALPNIPMPSPSCSRTLDARETERVRIVDIIKKLKNGDEHEHSNKEHKHCSTSDQVKRRCFSMVRNTPLLRGRQAVHDLLIQIERDKKRELDSLVQHHAVSKFSQRGRLQLMLRLRSLQRCRTIQDSCRPQLPAGQLNRLPQESMHLRGKFRAGAERLMAQQNVLAAWRCFQKDKNSTGNPQEREDTHFRKGDRSSWPVNRFLTNKNEDIHEQAKPFSDSIQQKTSIEARCCDSPKIAKPRTPLKGKSKNEVSIKQGSNSQQHPFLGSRETVTRNEGSHEQAKPFSDSIQLNTRLEARCCESPKIAKPRTPLKGKSKNEVSVKQGSNSQQHLFLGSQETVTRNEDIHEQAKPFSDSIQLKTWLEARCCESPKIAKPRTPLKGKLKNEMSIKQGFNSQQHLFLGSQETVTRNEDIHEQAMPFSDSIQHKTRLGARCSESPKIAKPRTPLKRQLENEVTIKQGSNSQEHLFLGSQETATQNEVAKVDQEKDQHHFCLESQGTMESTTSLNFSVENEIGEEEGDYHHQHLKLQSQSQDTVENENGEEEGNGHHQHLGPESQDTVENEIGEEEGDGHHQHLGLDSQSQDTVENEIGEEKGNENRQHPELDSQSQDALEKSTTYYINDSNENEVPEEEDDQYQQYFEESNEYDWFSNISRPKSYWESIRKAWYNEVLNTAPKNEDIRELVQRGRVSTLLVSDFRESMDQLLTCRVQIQVDLAESHQDVEDMEGTISRERVSNLICSDFVERMKRLITSRAQSQADGAESQREVEGKIEIIEPMCSLQTNLHREGDQGEEQEEEDDNDNGEEDEDEEERSLSSHECQQEVEGKEETLQPMCCQQTNLHPEGDQGAEEQEDDDDDEYEGEEERSLSSHECHEANNYCDHSSSSLQMPSPDVMVTRSWSSQDDNETGNDYERGASEFSPPPQQSQAPCFQDARQSSSTNRPSLEMELKYDLKGHIEQLHLEMSELRKSFLSCMDMQMKMHQYAFNQKVHLVEEEVKNSADKLSWKRTCCICYEKQVDSLLYRCGHMCTCLKCGNELQWKSGQCPICQTSILDVVPVKY